MSLPEIERRRNAAEIYYANYQKHLVERNLAKASEDIWGVVNQLASALSILLRGKPISNHRELREFIKHVAYAKATKNYPNSSKPARRYTPTISTNSWTTKCLNSTG